MTETEGLSEPLKKAQAKTPHAAGIIPPGLRQRIEKRLKKGCGCGWCKAIRFNLNELDKTIGEIKEMMPGKSFGGSGDEHRRKAIEDVLKALNDPFKKGVKPKTKQHNRICKNCTNFKPVKTFKAPYKSQFDCVNYKNSKREEK